MAVRRVVIAEHGERAENGHAFGVERHEDLALLRMLRAVGIGLAHDDRDFAARIAGAGGPPFAAIDHVMVAVAQNRALDIGGVRGGDRGLRHQKRRTDFAVHQRLQPFILVRARAVTLEQFHIAGIGRGAIEHLGRELPAAHDFRQRRVFEIGKAGAFERERIVDFRMPAGGRDEHVPEAGGFRLLLQILDHLDHFPAAAFTLLRLIDRDGGDDVIVHEALHAVDPRLGGVGMFEIHCDLPLLASMWPPR